MGCPYGGAQLGARRGHRQGLSDQGPRARKHLQIVGKTQRSETDCVPWGASPPKADILHLLCVLPHDLVGVFVHWALGLRGFAGALGARPAALPHEGTPNSYVEKLDECLVS